MKEDVSELIDRAVAALERARGGVVATRNEAGSELERANSELKLLRRSAEASTRTLSELSLRNGKLASEVELLKAKLIEHSAQGGEDHSAEIEKMLKEREQDLVELDSVLTEMDKLVGKSNG